MTLQTPRNRPVPSAGPALLHHFLEESARLRPEKPAYVQDGRRYTYRDINSRAEGVAGWLGRHNVRTGARVAILLQNSIEYVVGYYGVLKAGAVAVPLNFALKPEPLRRILEEVDPAAAITSREHERDLAEAIGAMGRGGTEIQAVLVRDKTFSWPSATFPVVGWEHAALPEEQGARPMEPDPSLLASIVYTSGSTGSPKGVMLTHGNLVSNTLSIVEYLRLDENDIQMVVLPFYYVMGKSLLNTHFAVGATVVASNRFAYPASVLEQMVAESVTGFSGVPSTYEFLLHRSPLAAYRDRLSSLRYCSQAGGHMASATKEKLLQALPGHTKLYVMYGATEAAARLTYVDPEILGRRIDSIGKPIPGVTVKVVDEAGREVAPGVTGELVAQGPNIMKGYWRDPEATRRVLDGDGYHTGDLGYRDEDGYLYVTGRKDNLLKVGGHRIDPAEIEAVLLETEKLAEVAVFGVPDSLMGQKIVALAVPTHRDTEKREILLSCLAKLPRHKIPSEIRFTEALPRNSHGKIDRLLCQACFRETEPPQPGANIPSEVENGIPQATAR
jgi:long-chain acyl-CoA synthetase